MVSHENIGAHNQLVTSAIIHERFCDGRIDKAGDTRRPFVAASIAKLYLAAAMMRMCEEGSLDLSGRVHITLDDFRQGRYGTGRLKYTNQPLALFRLLQNVSPDIPITVRPISSQKLLFLMVRDSDNIATLAMVNKAGRKNLQQVLGDWGMKDTTVFDPAAGTNNMTTADDVHLFLNKLYKGFIIDPERAEGLRHWMPQGKVRDRERVFHGTNSMYGRVSEEGRSYTHRLGYIEGSTDHAFVILTESRLLPNGKIPYTQEKRIPELLERVAGFVV